MAQRESRGTLICADSAKAAHAPSALAPPARKSIGATVLELSVTNFLSRMIENVIHKTNFMVTVI